MGQDQRVRGTRDLFDKENQAFRFIENQGLEISKKYGYQEIETPIFEASQVFHRTLGETSDVVHKETYTFLDRGGDSITLRPEGTAGIARAFISEGLAHKIPLKYFYSGPMFRYERPQKGRYRQFQQVGVECMGIDHPIADADCISLGFEFLKNLGLSKKIRLEINTLGDSSSRQLYREKLVAYLSAYKNDLSADSQVRLEKNPLRIFDSKIPKDQEIVLNAPRLFDCLNDESKKFFDIVKNQLNKISIEFIYNDRLVRGLDYYDHTVFEFVTTELGAQGTVLGGGRYNGLIELMGGPKTPCVGWAAGVDRLADLVDSSLYMKTTPLIAIIPADELGETEALSLCLEIRQAGHRSEIFYSGNVGKKMKKADSMGAEICLIVGTNEVQSNSVSFKNMKTGEQKILTRTANWISSLK